MITDTSLLIFIFGFVMAVSSAYSIYVRYKVKDYWHELVIFVLIGLSLIFSSLAEMIFEISKYQLTFVIIISLLTAMVTVAAFTRNYELNKG